MPAIRSDKIDILIDMSPLHWPDSLGEYLINPIGRLESIRPCIYSRDITSDQQTKEAGEHLKTTQIPTYKVK